MKKKIMVIALIIFAIGTLFAQTGGDWIRLPYTATVSFQIVNASTLDVIQQGSLPVTIRIMSAGTSQILRSNLRSFAERELRNQFTPYLKL